MNQIVLYDVDGLRFNILYSSTLVISERREDDNERLCAAKPRLLFKRFPPPAGIEIRTDRSAGQRLTNWATGDLHQKVSLHYTCFGIVPRQVKETLRLDGTDLSVTILSLLEGKEKISYSSG